MGFLQILALLANIVPSVVSLMVQIETLIGGSGKGSDKKAVVLNTVHQAAVAAGHTAQAVSTLLPAVSGLVDTVATVLNQNNLWGEATEKLPEIQAAILMTAKTAKTIETLAAQVEQFTPMSAGD